ncbi:MAG: serine/threonine protein kinase [Lentisphaeria bacterium]|nr:serine/threonine protein kinase [Lentisphaeria bacterium]
MSEPQIKDETQGPQAAGETAGANELQVSVPPAADYASPERDDRQVKIFCYNCQQKLDVTGLQPFAHLPCPSCGTDLIIPMWFDNYLLEEPCGRGGMASVYRALDIALDREVAVKVLDPDSPCSMDSFLNEARTAATINHSGVIPIYTCGVFRKQAYMVMQFMSGGSLEQKMAFAKGTPLPVNDVIQWIHDIAEGLEYAARHGIIHHDVKPGNMMLDADGNAKVGDFGLARKQQTVAVEKDSYGSPLYISPEKVSTGQEESPGDIYSLGASFYHLLTSTPPFRHENLEELLWMRVKQNPVPPIQLRADIPQPISILIMRMMNHSPELRPGYEEIIRDLNGVLHQNTDTTSLTLSKNMPLPKNADGMVQTNTTSSVRIKSPSVLLKRRRSSISLAPPDPRMPKLVNAAPDAPAQPEPIPLAKVQPGRKFKPGLLILILLAALMVVFIVFSSIQLIRANQFSPETVRTVTGSEK